MVLYPLDFSVECCAFAFGDATFCYVCSALFFQSFRLVCDRSCLIHRLYRRTNEGLRSFQYESYKSLSKQFFWHEMLGLFTHLSRRLVMGYLCSNIDIWDEKKEINRNYKFGKSTKKRGFYVLVSKTDRFFLAILTPPPNISLSFYRVELGNQGKPRWRFIMAPLSN